MPIKQASTKAKPAGKDKAGEAKVGRDVNKIITNLINMGFTKKQGMAVFQGMPKAFEKFDHRCMIEIQSSAPRKINGLAYLK